MEDPPNNSPRKHTRWLALLVLAIFLTGLLGIFDLPAERILFNPQSYKQALADENAYRQFPALLGQMIAQGGDVFLFGNGDRLLQVLRRSNYDAIVRQIFPDNWVHLQADGLVDQFWAYFNFQSPRFRLVVDFRPVKARLNGGQAAQISADIVQGFPPCQGDEILNWGLQALNGNIQNLPLCRPPEPLTGAANLLVEGLLKAGSAAMPDELDLAAAMRLPLALTGSAAPAASAAWNTAFSVFHFYRRANIWLPWVWLLLLVLLGFLARRSERGPLYWLSIGLLLPGFTALVVALLVGLTSAALVPYVITRLFGPRLLVFDLLVGMLAQVVARFTLAAALIALGVTLLGAIGAAAARWRVSG